MFLSTCLISSTRTIMSFFCEFMLYCELVQSVAPKPCSRGRSGMYSIYPSSIPICQRNLHHWPEDPEIINLTLSSTLSWQQRLAWGDGFALLGSILNKYRLFKAWISFPDVSDPPPCQLKVRGVAHSLLCDEPSSSALKTLHVIYCTQFSPIVTQTRPYISKGHLKMSHCMLCVNGDFP